MITATDLRPDYVCDAGLGGADLPHLAAYPYEDSTHPRMGTSTCHMCRQDIYIPKNVYGVPTGDPFILRLIIHEEDEL